MDDENAFEPVMERQMVLFVDDKSQVLEIGGYRALLRQGGEPSPAALAALAEQEEAIDLPQALDPFFTTRPVGQGSGQGLAQVHATVGRQHGGSIRFESRVGEGTCFVVALPVPAGKS